MRQFLASLKRNQIIKSLMILMSGSALAELVGILCSPLLSRLYTPEEFGVMGSLMAIVGVLSMVCTLKYEMAIILENDNYKAYRLRQLCIILLIFVSFLLSCCIFFFPGFVGSCVSDQAYLYIKWVVPLVFLVGFTNVLSSVLNRERDYRAISISLIYRRVGQTVIQLIMGFCGAHALGLIIGNVTGGVIASIILFVASNKFFYKGSKGEDSVLSLAREYYKFPLYSTPQSALSAISTQLPVFGLGYYYGIEAVGAYWFAIRILQLPVAVFGQSLRQVFYKEASSYRDNYSKVFSIYKRFTVGLSLAVIAPVCLIFLYGKYLFLWFFGEEWLLAGQFTEWMALWIGGAFVNPPSMMLFTVYQEQKKLLIYDFVLGVARFVSLFLLPSLLESSVCVIAYYSLISLLFYFILVIYWWCKLKVLSNRVNVG
ncbi:Membrane protein involved in the export of O-antigen and teichoic acid [Rubritalea squalenifaciens DSM 18772]|uniref:Membrane protein involved in the export of O-antigen and teichoic acid n=1 Tax=Rubritalea squalenifaciens DSM 18772 TaxID=1123071 RepID=A0A1M6QZJ0_9BACT|nr:oligosaccharide flippase family protein [Rubritalea squalenifaciens]SHK25518.1 Membrane protein involved in the export of O-antigen and teichoic acid [Rubritalea squalenifaciens DSM 18772]